MHEKEFSSLISALHIVLTSGGDDAEGEDGKLEIHYYHRVWGKRIIDLCVGLHEKPYKSFRSAFFKGADGRMKSLLAAALWQEVIGSYDIV